MEMNHAIENLKKALSFFDRVKESSQDEKIAVGNDHWDWLEAAARAVVEASSNECVTDA